jgi:hypothetical protein
MHSYFLVYWYGAKNEITSNKCQRTSRQLGMRQLSSDSVMLLYCLSLLYDWKIANTMQTIYRSCFRRPASFVLKKRSAKHIYNNTCADVRILRDLR